MQTQRETKLFVCSHRGCTATKRHGLGLCQKHYRQVRRHGRTFESTIQDKNTIVYREYYCELILTDNDLNEVGRARVDRDDIKRVSDLCRWSINENGYVTGKHDNKTVYLHRFIMRAPKHKSVDHIDTGVENRSNNCKSNLRLCNKTQNQQNKGKLKNNTSGFKGVCYYPKTGK